MKKNTFPSQRDVERILKFVSREPKKNTALLKKTALAWTRAAWENRLDYDITWLGAPIIQNPYDMILLQELIFRLRPDVIVETGVAHGGSLVYYASLCEILGTGRVIGIDSDIRPHNRAFIARHPMKKRITLLQGDSTDPAVVHQVKSRIRPGDTVLVCLDSDHRKEHVFRELEAYRDLVSRKSYLVVFDTFIPQLAGLKGLKKELLGNSPWEAVEEFLKRNKNFRSDSSYDKFFVSSCPNGFLQRIR